MLSDGKGKMFLPGEPWRVEIKKRTHMLNQKYNALTEYQPEERKEVLREILGELNENVTLQGPITFHYGRHTKIGKNSFINFNFTCQDDAEVVIGEECDFGPNVTIVTPLHPMLAAERRSILCDDGKERLLCWAKPVVIEDDCWLGASVTVCPGVTIGKGSVIGAGSVVTRDIPEGCFAAGVPAKVIRKITPEDTVRTKFDDFYG